MPDTSTPIPVKTQFPFVVKVGHDSSFEDRKTVVGSGVLISANHVLTCKHVVPGAEKSPFEFFVECLHETRTIVRAVVDRNIDLALLEFEQPIVAIPHAVFIEHLVVTGELADYLERGSAMLVGYPKGSQTCEVNLFPFHPVRTNEQKRVTRLSFEEAAADGSSGGPVIIKYEHQHYCLGIVDQGGEGKPKSLAIPSDSVISYASRNNINIQTRPSNEIRWRSLLPQSKFNGPFVAGIKSPKIVATPWTISTVVIMLLIATAIMVSVNTDPNKLSIEVDNGIAAGRDMYVTGDIVVTSD